MDNSTLRITRNIKFINKKKTELWEATQKRDFDNVYRTTIELLNWIVNSDDWFLKNEIGYGTERKKDNEVFGTLFGIRQAYNSFKHNMAITNIEDNKLVDSIFPGMQIEVITWVPSGPLNHPSNNKKAFENYQGYLEGKSVLHTFNIAVKFLNQAYSSIRAKSN